MTGAYPMVPLLGFFFCCQIVRKSVSISGKGMSTLGYSLLSSKGSIFTDSIRSIFWRAQVISQRSDCLILFGLKKVD